MLNYSISIFLILKTMLLFSGEPVSKQLIRPVEPAKKEYFWFNPFATVTVPNPVVNKGFRKNFNGVYDVKAGMDIQILNGLYAGAVYENATLKIIGISGANYFHYSPLMKINAAGLRIGGRTFIGERNKIILSGGITLGQSWTHYKAIRCKDSTQAVPVTKYSSPYVQPELNLIFLMEENFSIGATIFYSIINKEFNPYEICLDSWKAVGTVGSGPIQYFSFGFGFYYSFLRKKEK